MPPSEKCSVGGSNFFLHHFLKRLYHIPAPARTNIESTVSLKPVPGVFMATAIQHEELVRRALKYISERKQGCPDLSFDALLDEASLRFDLTPRDQEALERMYRTEAGGAQ